MPITRKNQSLNGFMALLLLIAVALACSSGGNETEKANKLIDEGNAANDEAKKHVAEAESLKKKMLNMEVGKLEEAHAVARETIAAYEKAEAKCKEAGAKYDEAASGLKSNGKFKEYLTLKVKEFNKRAELMQMAKGVPQALIDSKNRQEWVAAANAITKQINQLAKEAEDLSNQADKIQKDNPGMFKS